MCFRDKNKIDFSKVSLGAIPPIRDPRDIKFMSVVKTKTLPKFPPVFNVAQTMDFEVVQYLHNKVWGNDSHGDCVVVASLLQIIHAEYAEQRRILKEITTDQALAQYYKESGGRDSGLSPYYHLGEWRTNGLNLGNKSYFIDGYADIDIQNIEELKAACNWLYGAQVCVGLPLNAQKQYNKKRRRYEWIVEDNDGSELGSWGYHEMYCPGYVDIAAERWILFWTWGNIIRVSPEWYKKYAIQSTAILDQKDSWVDQSNVDFVALKNYIDQIKKGW